MKLFIARSMIRLHSPEHSCVVKLMETIFHKNEENEIFYHIEKFFRLSLCFVVNINYTIFH